MGATSIDFGKIEFSKNFESEKFQKSHFCIRNFFEIHDPTLLLHCSALLRDGKVSAETRGRAFPGVARPWEHCGRDLHRFVGNRNFENFLSEKSSFFMSLLRVKINPKSVIGSGVPRHPNLVALHSSGRQIGFRKLRPMYSYSEYGDATVL